MWPALQFFNFKMLPPSSRVLFVSGVSVGWNAFLSMMAHGHSSDSTEKGIHPSEVIGNKEEETESTTSIVKKSS